MPTHSPSKHLATSTATSRMRWPTASPVMRLPFAAAVTAMIVPIIPLGHLAQGVSAIKPDESHRGGFAAADDVLMFLRPHL